MNKLILTLCLIFIALIGASAVAASSDADNLSFELYDHYDFNFTPIYKESLPDVDVIEINSSADEISEDNSISENNSFDPIIFDDENDGAIVKSDLKNSTSDDRFIDNYYLPMPEFDDYDKIMKVFGEKKFDDFNESELLYLTELYEGILNTYDAGYSTKHIAIEYTMTPQEIQNIVDTCHKPFKFDSLVNKVVQMYGSSTLEEIAEYMGISEEDAKDYVISIKNGKYGEHFKKLFTRRDLVSLNEKHPEYIIK